jgi:hypothetical protein
MAITIKRRSPESECDEIKISAEKEMNHLIIIARWLASGARYGRQEKLEIVIAQLFSLSLLEGGK